MKPEFKVEGDVLIIKVAEGAKVDSDADGIAAVEASVAIEIKADGSELIEELAKSEGLVAKMIQKIKELGLA